MLFEVHRHGAYEVPWQASSRTSHELPGYRCVLQWRVRVLRRLLKAMADRLKQDAGEREAFSKFEITGAGELPATMRVMQPMTEREE